MGQERVRLTSDEWLDDVASTGVTQWARLVPSSEARGLESDASIVVGPQEIIEARPNGERDLYVALTCATKRLCSIAVPTSRQRHVS
ncbi:hypothetical protein GCM10009579_82570 [Streptomyces javensis]|uniref:UvrD-like helicase C-terminal domain-containing protein n=1 Tax=Streptomyces javensis TaxID=114698 RepID=A0ABN1XD55_9ACTN|nr:hypothetical protein [Streptomyces javensis]